MAGFYADLPAPRIAYDRDGTNYVWTQGVATYVALQTELNALNNEAANVTWTGNSTPFGSRPSGVRTGFIFPHLMDITHIFMSVGNNDSISAMEFSLDTTNLVDGTWTSTPIVGKETFGTVKPAHRTLVAAMQAPFPYGVRALRFTTSQQDGNRYVRAIHLYGNITTGETPDRLRVWHPTLDEPLDDPDTSDGSYFDWGDMARADSFADKTLRIKNNSATLTASSIDISTNVLTNTTPTLESQVLFSDGGPFASNINIGNLAPGALSSVITIRRTTDQNATLSLWTWRTIITATGGWI